MSGYVALANGPWSPPASFEEYRVVAPLSHGGMGDVYLGHDTLLDRPVAIKFIGANEPDAWMREQFLTEARAAARLQHPNVVSVYRVGEIDDRPYIIEELVRGHDLDALLTPLPWQRALDLGRGLARGLAAAHRCGVLHRDIKPGNAIISNSGEVKLIDFGLAEFVEIDAMSADSDDAVAPLAAAQVSAIAQTIEVSKSGAQDRAADMARGDVSFELADLPSAPTVPPPEPPRGSLPRRAAPSWRRGPRLSTRIVGTPHYMAPEIWLGEPSTRQSDLYAMGALLFELCTGFPPHHDVQGSHEELCHAVNTQDAPSLTTLISDIDPLFAAVIARCLRRDPSERYASADELRDALDQLRPMLRQAAAPEGNPYRGLFAFEAEHRSLFFGRSNEIGTVIERLRSEAFILVAADSGVGKSSLCRAGILPLIRDGAFGDGRQWQALTMVPGRHPIASLCAAVAPLLEVPEAQLAERLRGAPSALARDLPKQLGDQRGVVLFIDQLEEIVTLAAPEETALFGKVLGRLTMRVPGLRLLMTARSDFLARIASVAGLGDDLARALYFLRPMYPEKIREAIVGPAQVKGVRFESAALVDTLVDETAKTEGGLPLLQFALTELWDTRSHDLITIRSLEAIGGVAGALARHADQVILSLPADQRIAARRILLRLVTVEGTRARRFDEELHTSDAARQALEALTRGRMVIAHATSDGIIYEVAHEALLKGWGTLRHWLEEFSDSCAVKQRIESAAAEWVRLGRSRIALWSAPQLDELSLLDPSDFTPKEQAFIKASRQALSRSRLLRGATIVMIPLALATLYGGMQLKQLRERNHKVAAHLSRGQQRLAHARQNNREVEALRKSAFAAFDAQNKEEGEKRWARTLLAIQENDEAFVQASQALEAALAIDANRDDVRVLLAQSLFEGAQAADRDRRVARRNELTQRMALYDLDGARQASWHTPAQLTVETAPSAAHVTLQRYVDDARQRRTLSAEQDLGKTPLRSVSIQEGSYLLSMALPGRLPVRYPIVVTRAQNLRIAVELPIAAAVPQGFVYIPGGRFLFGTSSDEAVRQSFLSTVPLHEVSVGSFVISRQEVTYADWLEYLNALPPAERIKRTVHVPKGGIGGGVALKQLEGGSWQLTLQPVTQQHVARSGEPLRYASRKVRKEQDWLRLPISGIGPDDIRAYAAWLDAIGRVPGARLCTEYEWERAARGADDREYPHGNSLDPSEANFDETYGKAPDSAGPDEVGSHPATQSPFEVLDLAGNVFEWTTSSLAKNELALRGGGYFMSSYVARSTNRTTVDPGFRDPAVGARLCAPVRGGS